MFKVTTLRQHIFKTMLTALLLYSLLTAITAVVFLIYPVLNNSTDDLTRLIIKSAEQWQSLNATEKKYFVEKLYSDNKLLISVDTSAISGKAYLPYILLLEYKLNKALEQPVDFYTTEKKTTWYTARIYTQKAPLYISFSREKINTSPPLYLITALLFSLVLSIITSFYLAQHITAAMRNLINAAKQLSQGQLPDKIPETGHEEIRLLTISFNQMSRDVNELLDNRTTLLVGVSHNLRTPLARLHLALELLPDNIDAQLRHKIDASLKEMNETISQFLNLAHGMNKENTFVCNLGDIIHEITANLQHDKRLQSHIICDCAISIQLTALRQVLINITENALTYGDDKPVIIELECQPEAVFIRVIDQGSGIPDVMLNNIFQPFVRIANSRTKGTGLGLAIANLICKTHGWTLQLIPGIKGGTVAQLRLPRAPGAETI